MGYTFVRFVRRFLIVSLTAVSVTTANAGLVSVDQVRGAIPSDRTVVLDFLARDEVASALQARGVDPQLARERVGAMTDGEVSLVKAKIDTLPAGAFMSGDSAAFAIVAIVALIALIIWGIYRAFAPEPK